MHDCEAGDERAGRKPVTRAEGQKNGAWLQSLKDLSSRQVGKWQWLCWGDERAPAMAALWGEGNGLNRSVQSITHPDSTSKAIPWLCFCW